MPRPFLDKEDIEIGLLRLGFAPNPERRHTEEQEMMREALEVLIAGAIADWVDPDLEEGQTHKDLDDELRAWAKGWLG